MNPAAGVCTFASNTCIAECVDDTGRPVPDGTASARVLVTNLHNLTRPLIRYELTDRFIPAAASAGGFRERRRTQRRHLPLRRHQRAPVRAGHATAAHRADARVSGPPDGAGADVTVVADASLDEAALAATVEQSLREAGVTEPHVTISRAAAIARDPRTGKVRRGRNTAETGRWGEDSQFSAR